MFTASLLLAIGALPVHTTPHCSSLQPFRAAGHIPCLPVVFSHCFPFLLFVIV